MIFDTIFKRRKKEKNLHSENVNVITDKTNYRIVESYKSLRANINFAIPSAGCKKIMISSSYSGEGKTTTCINLGVTIAQTGASVVLIDCDLRRPKIHKYLNIDNNIGISSYLSNMAELEKIIKDTDISNLKVITVGITPPNPAELISGAKMKELLEEIEKIADYIIIDTPPICIVSDALPLSKLCDGVILMVRHMQTTHTNIKESLEKLNFAGAHVIGMVLNGIKIKHNYKSYNKYSYYSKTK